MWATLLQRGHRVLYRGKSGKAVSRGGNGTPGPSRAPGAWAGRKTEARALPAREKEGSNSEQGTIKKGEELRIRLATDETPSWLFLKS